MLRVVFRLLLATAFVAGAGPACSGTTKSAKKAKKSRKGNTNARSLVSEARDDAKAGDYDAADKKYAEAYEASKDFDILEEHVDFLIHAGRASKAIETAKVYYDAQVSDSAGW